MATSHPGNGSLASVLLQGFEAGIVLCIWLWYV